MMTEKEISEIIEHKGIKYEPETNQNDKSWYAWDRPRIIAVDLDGTLFKSDTEEWKGPEHFFETIEHVREKIELINQHPRTWIMIWTCRNRKNAIKEILDERGIPFHSINEHPFEPEDIGRKPPYDILLGDTEWRYDGRESVEEFYKHVMKNILNEEDEKMKKMEADKDD